MIESVFKCRLRRLFLYLETSERDPCLDVAEARERAATARLLYRRTKQDAQPSL